MKVLHVAESIWGGCGTYLNEIVPLQLQSLGPDQVRCVVPAEHVAQLSSVPPEVIQTFKRPSRLRGLPALAASVVQAVRDWQPDLIHAHSTFAGGIVRTLSTGMSLPPVVYCPHGWVFDVDQPGLARSATQLVERLLSKRCARIVAISESERCKGVSAGIKPARLTVISNGIRDREPVMPAEWPDHRLRVLFVGRLDRQKGVDVLLSAVADLAEHVCVRVVGQAVVGQGDVAAPGPHVEFMGWMNHDGVAAQLSACDVVVMPSRWEGFGLVAVEAMRASKPVFASNTGGLAEIVLNGRTGRLFPVDDAPALHAMLAAADREQLAEMGRQGRERFVERYTIDHTHRELMRLYAAVAGNAMRSSTQAPSASPMKKEVG